MRWVLLFGVLTGIIPSFAQDTILRVNSPPELAGVFLTGVAEIGPAIVTIGPVTGDLVLYLDQGGSTQLGCVPPSNVAEIAGKIAFIDRGDCNFVTKAKNAQLAGAIGVLIANTYDGVISMGGTDPSITIPTLMISKPNGDSLKVALPSGVNVTLDLSPCPTYTEFFNSVVNWNIQAQVVDLILLVNYLPGWTLFIDSMPIPIQTTPDETSMGSIIVDETLSLKVRHWGNRCIMTGILGSLSSGDGILTPGTEVIGPNYTDVPYTFEPDSTGNVQFAFALNDEIGKAVQEATLTLYVNPIGAKLL